MKKQTNIGTKAKSQNRADLKNDFTGAYPMIIWQNPKQDLFKSVRSTGRPRVSLPSKERQKEGFNFGNDPPGRSRSPDKACGLNPDKRFIALLSCKTNSRLNFNCYKNFTMI